MKFNITYPVTGMVKVIECDEDRKLLPFIEKRMAAEVPGDTLGDEWKGYVFRITGGNDKQGFPMMQGVLTNQRVRLLFKDGMKTFRERRKGCRKRKSVRGCVTGNDLAVMCLQVVKKGDEEIPGLTDGSIPRRLGPKRASKIRKLFNLDKNDDVRKFVIRREVGKGTKAPKIQRLVTPRIIHRKKQQKWNTIRNVIRGREEKKIWQERIIAYQLEQKEAKAAEVAKKKAAKVTK